MHLKSHRTKFWIIGGAVLLLAGIVVFCFLHSSVEPVITHGVDKEELPKIQAGVRHFRAQKIMGAFRNRNWQKLPKLLADCLGRPVAEVRLLAGDKDLVVTRGKQGGHTICYYLVRSGPGWTVRGEMSPVPGTFLPGELHQ
jgi:hypothetical protein